MQELTIGLTAQATDSVTEKNTAQAVGSGDLPAYATPAMLALMEKAATLAIAACLPADTTTVGTKADIAHIAATPRNMNITATAELIEIDKRKLTFNVTATDDHEKIGEGIHERFIIKKESFLQKTVQKKQR